MLNTDKQHINLRLDAHSVGLDVPRDQEPNYRAAAELFIFFNLLFGKVISTITN